jgi:trehalose 6-phosphate synthase
MGRGVRFAAVLVAGFVLATVAVFIVVDRTTSAWFERDLVLRAELAVNGARQGLLAAWGADREQPLKRVLTEIAHDERIMAAGLCSADLRTLAHTGDYRDQFSCRRLGALVRPHPSATLSDWYAWNGKMKLADGNIYVSAIPLIEDGDALGFVVLVHDLSFLERRERRTRDFLVGAFGLLALGSFMLLIIALRVSRRDWQGQLRRLLRREEPQTREFQPLLRDMRELMDEVLEAERADGAGGRWTPERLKQALNRYLRGERIVVVANREPYIHERNPEGTVSVKHPASGLVTALEPIMRACSGVWIAHGGGSADRETADSHGRVRVPPGEESYSLRRVWLTPEQEQGYYYGFANEGLWPLCHIAHTRPIFRSEDWKHYQAVNLKFAEAVVAEVDSDDPVILVQDYHFAIAPRLIRERLPRATIISFWHIPWPNSEHFGICPFRDELLEGMLGSSILGFHTQFHCNNFLDSVDRFLESRIDREENAVVQHGRSTFVRPYPISLEWPNHWLDGLPAASECRAAVFAELGLAKTALLGVGVDRLDYTKGIEERLLAVERTLERSPELRGRLSFVQLAAPSRTLIERYRQLDATVHQVAARINERFGHGDYRPIVLLSAHHEPPTVFRFYRAADVCYVSSLHDGMNLVAKEFVAARDDEGGVLVLSQFTGAARELPEALLVNPYDLEEASAALMTALKMPASEQRERMRSMRAFVSEFNIYRWAGRMVADAARLRRRDRLASRLAR